MSARAAARELPPEAPRLLVAEDDGPSAAVLRAVLQREGYRMTLAEDGISALRVLEEEGPPDLMLLDWMLPGLSGLEVCHRVRQRWSPIELPILIVTARADAESISAAFDAGASDYLAKPFLGAELRARIAAHLRTKRLIEERQQMEEHLRERQKLSSLGLLVSGVAHDLNTPLTSISGFAQLLLRDEEEGQKAEDLRHILSEVGRCQRIAGSLLSFARRHPPERALVEIAALVRGTVELRERHLRTSGIRFSVALDELLPGLVADGHQLQQVFLNILLNAEQAVRLGGETLRITARSAETVGVGVSAPAAEPPRARGTMEPWIAVEFYNDGPPIPREVLPRIFEPFFTTKSEDEGTGLGLAICNRIVREHGGRIEVESGVEGTTFRILLPGVPARDPG